MDSLTRIKELLTDKNWSVYKLSKKSGVSQSTLSNMFNRNTSPTINTLEEICKAFEITLSQFFTDNKEITLSNEQEKMLEKWSTLTSKQKKELLTTLK